MHAIGVRSRTHCPSCTMQSLSECVTKIIKKIWEIVSNFFAKIYAMLFSNGQLFGTDAITREIANAPIDADVAHLTYMPKAEIQGMYDNRALFLVGDDTGAGFEGVAAVPCQACPEKNPPLRGRYLLHLCPGGGYSQFNREEINQMMEEAIRNLANQNAHICCISGNIGRHPGNTLNLFQNWQADNRQL